MLVCLSAKATGMTDLALSERFILEQAGGFHPNTKDHCSIAPLCIWLNFMLTEPTFSRLWLTTTKPQNRFKTCLVIICFHHQWVGKKWHFYPVYVFCATFYYEPAEVILRSLQAMIDFQHVCGCKHFRCIFNLHYEFEIKIKWGEEYLILRKSTFWTNYV